MTDKDFNHLKLGESDLDKLFDAARDTLPIMDPDFLDKLQIQAFEAMPITRHINSGNSNIKIFKWISTVIPQFGGLRVSIGLVLIAAIGVITGFNPPDLVLDFIPTYFDTETLIELAGINNETQIYWEDF